MPSFTRSKELLARAMMAEAIIAERPSIFLTGYEPVRGAPKFVKTARGSRITDVDGNEFIDLVMGYGSVILGHAYPEVQQSVIDSISNGANPTLLSEVQVELAELFQECIPNAERVTFLKTGSDAVDAAVRLSRAVSSKKYVLHCGMHGWHDWCCAASPGVLQESKAFTIGFEYGNLEDLRVKLELFSGDVACVAMVPYDEDLPEGDYLIKVRELCDDHSVILVFDEVRSGFRISLGGAQEYFGVKADLTAFSKAMANGFSISALAGRADLMCFVLDLNLTLTFFRDPVAMAAAVATIREMQNRNVHRALEFSGNILKECVSNIAMSLSIPVELIGHSSSPAIRFSFSDAQDNSHAKRAFCSSMIENGIIVNPLLPWFMSYALLDDELERVERAIRSSMENVKKIFV